MHARSPTRRIRTKIQARLLSAAAQLALIFVLIFAVLFVPTYNRQTPWPEHPVHAAAKDTSAPPLDSPDMVCAPCHAAIYASYERTQMAQGSGTAAEGFIPGEFKQESSGVTYRIFERDGREWMSFSRPAESASGPLQGEQQLLYFVGSGHQGRTFLYRVDDQWFELPVNYYGRLKHWGMAPAYDDTRNMPASLPVDANCIHCHASEVGSALPECRNRFSHRPFDQGGIGCAACHGDPSQHLAAHGHGPILNPATFSVPARDSACIQCHLEGNATVYRPGKSLAQFRPGDTLSDFAIYFVRADQADGGRRASSQYEALLQSACKKASGDKLTCTTCHDPHSTPTATDRVAYFRERCLSCHTSPALASTHHPEQPDCSFCHMPRRATSDISHEQETDHNIQRVPLELRTIAGKPRSEDLVPVGIAQVGDRELGLAYAQLARKGDRIAAARALMLLRRAEQAEAADEQVHVTLGFLDQLAGDAADARQEYAAALRTAPFDPTALTNRAVLDASGGDLPEALRLLDRLVRADPSQTESGLDLAFLECRLGHPDQGRAVAEQLRRLNPDSQDLRTFLNTGTLGTQSCPAMIAIR